MAIRLDYNQANFEAHFSALLDSKRESNQDVADVVASILARIRNEGDTALLELTEEFDRFKQDKVAALAISKAEMQSALDALDPSLRAALEMARDRIRVFHEKQVPDDFSSLDDDGVALSMRYTPVDAAGLYVPGGKAAYPSSVLMNAIPAAVAGVERRVMVVPAPDGYVNPLVLAAAALAEVTEIWRVGGAQAVAALAYGTQTIASVDKIVGPGNAFVATAKRQVFGTVGIDSIAGPSEILVIADAQNDPEWIAADLLSQAEHDEAAQSIMITDDADFADAVDAAVTAMLPRLDRATVAGQSWADNGAIITVPDMAQMPELANRIAAEHLELAVADPEEWAAKIRHAGAIFLGRYTPEAIGDYIAGPNHVLPTARTAKFSSGLGVVDFMKRTTLVGCDAGSFARIAPAGVTLAEAEGLGAHALSMTIRMTKSK
ncbi:MAG: histidinol dehydrogenase [Candidatus Puniceispirillum sp.]|jgi:histidinol dehydrogenase|uniref:histidinol dehydrogenase n=1 Tax=Candidatus Puniceispirillum sp. TaxID=2026719 RepID=UPI001ED5FD1E|nr:histidinol dehydrogenase [Candidatus Puniceispirillum sp.]MBT6415231.1 histidinol dehydrogenase [Candidatus Puniceispirillum sp.]MBT6566137.1 histidinol dehydrogenase [Candidatus Puniceispirillum sp.]